VIARIRADHGFDHKVIVGSKVFFIAPPVRPSLIAKRVRERLPELLEYFGVPHSQKEAVENQTMMLVSCYFVAQRNHEKSVSIKLYRERLQNLETDAGELKASVDHLLSCGYIVPQPLLRVAEDARDMAADLIHETKKALAGLPRPSKADGTKIHNLPERSLAAECLIVWLTHHQQIPAYTAVGPHSFGSYVSLVYELATDECDRSFTKILRRFSRLYR
jgi:hypothetical protein